MFIAHSVGKHTILVLDEYTPLQMQPSEALLNRKRKTEWFQVLKKLIGFLNYLIESEVDPGEQSGHGPHLFWLRTLPPSDKEKSFCNLNFPNFM